MRWPWRRATPEPERETRDSGGGFSDAVLRLIEAQAAGKAADTASTAAMEAASGSLSRAFASATVSGAAHVREAVTPGFLAQVGRDLVRSGESMHVIDVSRSGRVALLPCSSWHFEGGARPDTWTVRATFYGPSTSTTRHVPYSGVVFATWGSRPGTPYVGSGPLSWASITARLQSETERALADEAGGPIANLLAIPDDGGDGGDDDPLKMLKADIAAARGKAVLVETTAAGWGEGMSAAPRRDWTASRLGANPPEALAMIRRDAFEAVLAACGTPPSLFLDSDGTAQREAVRRWHLGTVLPLAVLLEAELAEKLEGDCRLKFDAYPLDLAGRAQAFQKLVAGGVAVTEALATSGLLAGD